MLDPINAVTECPHCHTVTEHYDSGRTDFEPVLVYHPHCLDVRVIDDEEYYVRKAPTCDE